MRVRRTRRRTGGSAGWLGVALAVGLAGCGGPIEAWRSLNHLNKNDPDPATALFTENVDKAETGSYPNLASVPPVPVVTSTAADRTKLTETLTATGASAQAPDAHGTRGTPSSGPVPPPPPIPPSLAAVNVATQPLPPPSEQPAQTAMRRMDEPPVRGSPVSAEQPPAIQTLPGAEHSRSAPPPGTMSAIPQPAPSDLPPAATQSGNPRPSPPVAVLQPVAPPPEAATRPPPKLPPVPTTVATLDLPAGATALGPDAQSRLAQVTAQVQHQPRSGLRIVAYAAPAAGSAEQLNSFRAALDRAQLVAKSFTDAGVPAKQIQTEAAPSSAANPTGRVEVQTLP